MIAQPIAKAIDTVFHTNIQSCSGCKSMTLNLNQGMGFGEAIYDRFWPKKKEEK